MLSVGLTGGYATGKSFVAAELERLGCLVIYADKLGHQVLHPDGEAYAPVVSAFGLEILKTDGHIDRRKLGQLAFASPERLAELNRYVHPAVFRLEEELISAFASGHPHGIAIVEAAILVETGRYKHFDRLIVTACSEDVQIARAMARDNGSEDQVRARMRMQMPQIAKQAFADFIVETGGTAMQTIQQVEKIYQQLRSEA